MRKYFGSSVPKGYRWIVEHVNHEGEDCLLWPFSCCTPGYGTFMFEEKTYLAHRWMCQQVYGDPPYKTYHAAHSCGNRRCVNPTHLSWKTQSDNQLDRREHGTHNKTRRKITEKQAQQIRSLKGIETGIETAAKYGVTESNVRQIQDGKTWANRGKMHIWTPDDDMKIREAISRGYNFRQMAEFVGQTQPSTMMRAYRIGLRSGQPLPAKRT